MAGDEAKVTFRVFNQDFNQAMSEMNKSAKDLRQELKLEQEQLKMTGSESQKLASTVNSLQKQYEIAQQKTKSTADQLEAVKRQFGDNSVEAGKMETKLRSAEIAEQQLANKISQTTEELNKAKQAESEATSESAKHRQALSELQNEQTNLESSSKKLSSEYDLQKARMGENASEAEKMAAAQEHVQKQADVTKQVIANLERQLSLVEQEYGKNSTEANQMEAKLNEAKTSVANLDNEFEKIKSSGADAAESMDGLGKKISAGNFMHAAEILSDVGDKIVDLGKSAIEGASEVADSQQDIQNNFGLTSAEAEKVQGVVSRVFEHGVTDSMETTSKSVQTVKSYMGDLNNVQLENVTNKVIAIGKHTDTDVNENVRAASQLMKNFGLSADSSLDLIAAGFQNGLNYSDDFLDTLNEYSPQFSQAGFNAKDMLNIINQGMVSGAFNTDKAADAVKEFGIRLRDGTIEKNIGLYSTHTQDLFKQFQSGKATTAQVFQSINKDIAGTDDKTKKYNMGVSSMGTQYEDLGDKAVAAFAKTGKSIDNVNGKADQMAERSPGEKWQQSLRELQDVLKPIGTDLIETLTPIVEIIGKIAKVLTDLPGPVRIFVEVFTGLIVLLTILTPIIAAATIAFGTFSTILLPIIIIIAGIAVAVAIIITVIKNWGAITEWLSGVWAAFTTWLSGLWQGISSTAQSIFSGIASFFSSVWAGISSTASTVWVGISAFLTGAWSGIVSVASTIWNGIVIFFQFMWELVKAIFQGAWLVITSILIAAWNIIVTLTRPIWEPIATFFLTLWTGIQNVVSAVWSAISIFLIGIWNGIMSFASPIFNAVGLVITTVWNTVRSVTSSVWNTVAGVLTTIWNVIKSVIQSALSIVQSVISSAWNVIQGVTSSIWNAIRGVILGVWNGIKSGVSSAINAVRSVVSSVWNGIKSVTSSVWNGIKSAIINPINAAKNTVANIINTIKGFFKGIHLSLPKINLPPLPHFKLTGSFSLKPPSVPHLGVEWYANGGIFDQANLIGIGEAGREAALPLVGHAMDPFADAVANRMLSSLPQIAQSQLAQSVTNNNNITINATVRNDQDMDKLIDIVNEGMGKTDTRQKAAWGNA